MRIAIQGAGIAGPTLAWWLSQSGHDVLLVEKSPELRRGGYLIDFWGIGYDVAEKMALLPEIRAQGYRVGEVRLVDRFGQTTGGFGVDVFRRLTHDRFTSLRRSDLAATIYAALDGRVETIFGDSVAAISEGPDCVRLAFEHSAPLEVDLLVGADGLHSRIRELAFGPEASFEVSLGYHVAAFELTGYRPRDELVYVSHAVAGRQLSRFAMRGDKTLFLFVFADRHMEGVSPSSESERKSVLTSVFADVGWEAPRILTAMESASPIYFDHVSQIRMDRWARGRTVLVGDAAAAVSLLAGEGTGLAMAEAYVLAGELRNARNDHSAAFGRYEQRLAKLLKSKQKSAANFASSFAPKTSVGVALRNSVTRLLRIPALAEFFIGRDLRDPIELPHYGS